MTGVRDIVKDIKESSVQNKDDIVNALQTVVLADSEDETETDRMVKQAVISLTEVKPTANEKPVIDDNLTVGVNAICESAHSPRLGRETPVEHVAMRHQQHCDICFAPSLFSIDCLLQTRNSTADASASPYDEGINPKVFFTCFFGLMVIVGPDADSSFFVSFFNRRRSTPFRIHCRMVWSRRGSDSPKILPVFALISRSFASTSAFVFLWKSTERLALMSLLLVGRRRMPSPAAFARFSRRSSALRMPRSLSRTVRLRESSSW